MKLRIDQKGIDSVEKSSNRWETKTDIEEIIMDYMYDSFMDMRPLVDYENLFKIMEDREKITATEFQYTIKNLLDGELLTDKEFPPGTPSKIMYDREKEYFSPERKIDRKTRIGRPKIV